MRVDGADKNVGPQLVCTVESGQWIGKEVSALLFLFYKVFEFV